MSWLIEAMASLSDQRHRRFVEKVVNPIAMILGLGEPHVWNASNEARLPELAATH